MNENNHSTTRPWGVVHLIFGLVFGGIAAIWLIGESRGSDTSHVAAGIPVVLIGAGIIGLAVIVLNQRRAKSHAYSLKVEAADVPAAPEGEATTQFVNDDTINLSNEKEES